MNKAALVATLVFILAGVGIVGAAFGNSAVKGDAPSIKASPQTIVLAKISAVTIHTNIPASSVAADTLAFNGAVLSDTWADDLGHLAARCDVADLALEPGTATLTLTGGYVDGGGFSASDTVRVK